ncbi:hypothetical protein RhiirA4_480935, partial [Rhizophagus irregularis]
MSNMGDSVGNTFEEDFLKFVSEEGEAFLSCMTFQLGQFVENGFLKKLFDKSPLAMDKATLLIEMFGASTNTQQAAATAHKIYLNFARFSESFLINP